MFSTGLGVIVIGTVGIAGIAGIVGIAYLWLTSAAGAAFEAELARAETRQRGREEAHEAMAGWQTADLVELSSPDLHEPIRDDTLSGVLAMAQARRELPRPARAVVRAAAPARAAAAAPAKLVMALPGQMREQVREGGGAAGDWLTARHDAALAAVREQFAAIRERGAGGTAPGALR
jgi:hypothetical protein